MGTDALAGPAAAVTTRRHRWLGTALIVLAAGIALNSLLGPLVAGMIDYPLTETLMNQTIGLELFALVLIVPWSVGAATLVLRGHRAGPVLALAPALYTAYMFVQYVVGPNYLYYPGALALHLGLFTLGGAVALAAWSAVQREVLPVWTHRSERVLAVLLLGFAAFVVSRYLPDLARAVAGDPLPVEAAEEPAMFWSIVLLDLGVVVPATVAAAVAVLLRASWARAATFAIVGWFALVPPAVVAMAIVMLVNDDPHAQAGDTVVLGVVTVVFAAVAVWLYRPLFGAPVQAAGRTSP